MELWQARQAALVFMQEKTPSRLSVMNALFQLMDDCIDAYEVLSATDDYARVCGLTILKAKNLAVGSYSLLLDGLGQEAGALLRPMIEYVELLTYFRKFPHEVQGAVDNELPKAGARAKAVAGIYEGLRRHLNEHASHSSYSSYSLSHLLNSDFSFRKLQHFVPEVLDRNLRDLAVQLWLMLHEAILGLEHVKSAKLIELATRADALKGRMIHVFELDAT